MVTLTFDLDYDKMNRDGVSEHDMLSPMRDHSKKYGISESSKGVFFMEGENALCDIMLFVLKMASDSSSYVRYLKTWILTTAGGSEDCKQEMIKHYREEGIEYID